MSQVNGSTTTIYPNKYYSITSTTVGATTYATSTVYVWNGDTLIATIDQPMVNGAATGTAATRYIHPDHLGSTNIVTDESGNIVQDAEMYPYGETRLNQTTYPTNENRRFIGQFTDANSLQYLNARYLNSQQGQFYSEDPVFLAAGDQTKLQNPAGQSQQTFLTDPQSMNAYSYGRDNPEVNKDPSGFWYIQLAGTEAWGTEYGTGGVRFDQYGIEYYGGFGTGAGVEAGVEVEGSTGDLTHKPQVAVEYSGTWAEGFGGTGSFVTSADPGCKQPCAYNGSTEAGFVIGGGTSAAVSVQYSHPLITWRSVPSKYNLMNPPPGQNQYVNLNNQNASLSSSHGVYAGTNGSSSGGSLSLTSTLSALKLALSSLSSVLSSYH
jgi:RHS repeat-associated protein